MQYWGLCVERAETELGEGQKKATPNCGGTRSRERFWAEALKGARPVLLFIPLLTTAHAFQNPSKVAPIHEFISTLQDWSFLQKLQRRWTFNDFKASWRSRKGDNTKLEEICPVTQRKLLQRQPRLSAIPATSSIINPYNSDSAVPTKGMQILNREKDQTSRMDAGRWHVPIHKSEYVSYKIIKNRLDTYTSPPEKTQGMWCIISILLSFGKWATPYPQGAHYKCLGHFSFGKACYLKRAIQ